MPLTRTDFEPVDFKAVFEQSASRQLLLDTSLLIVAVTDSYLAATMTTRAAIIGHYLFEVFPDNPDWSHAHGVSMVHQSLLRVIQTRMAEEMPIQRYDIRKPLIEGGEFEERHWRPRNAPILGPDGLVNWVVHQVEDVTELVLARCGS